MTEAELEDGWKRANVSRILSEMERYGITLQEVQQALQSEGVLAESYGRNEPDSTDTRVNPPDPAGASPSQE